MDSSFFAPHPGYEITESEALPEGKVIVMDEPTAWSRGRIVVPNMYKFAIGLWGIGDDIIELCCTHAKNKIRSRIDYITSKHNRK